MTLNYLATNPQTLKIKLSKIVPEDCVGKRLDQTMAILFPDYSRETLKKWILNGSCLINGKTQLPKFKLKGTEIITIDAQLENKTANYVPENLPINIVYEDLDLLIINKSSNLVVHPGAGNWSGTLLNGLINYLPELRFIPRAGIIHRLDQDTSGLMIIAKNLPSYHNLINQFKNRTVNKIYTAIVYGNLISGGTINEPIGRSKSNRLKMQVTAEGKPAITHYKILQKFKAYTYIKINIVTGRTHQIRVHMQHINHPILGDRLYGKHSNLIRQYLNRQALHAKELTFCHPKDGRELNFSLDLPEDLKNLLVFLEKTN